MSAYLLAGAMGQAEGQGQAQPVQAPGRQVG